jgi:Na+/melibiose symporter-like transporter
MSRVAQIGIALGLLGVMLTLMGLFPGVTGIEPTDTIGIIQIVTILVGLALLILGGLIFVKFTFYARKSATLAQQIAIRLALTGIVFATISGQFSTGVGGCFNVCTQWRTRTHRRKCAR